MNKNKKGMLFFSLFFCPKYTISIELNDCVIDDTNYIYIYKQLHLRFRYNKNIEKRKFSKIIFSQ